MIKEEDGYGDLGEKVRSAVVREEVDVNGLTLRAFFLFFKCII